MDTLNGLQQRSLDTWTDLSAFNRLHAVAVKDSKAALPAVARQFEAIFTQMMLKSMREAGFGDPIFDSQAMGTYQGLFDQQLALSLSGKGKGLGIADMLVRQLGGREAPGSSVLSSHALPGDRTVSATMAPAVPADDASSTLMAAALRAAGAALDTAVPGAGSAVEAVSTGRWHADSPADFVRKVAPYARAAARKLGVSVRAVLAQAALETGWGRHMPAAANGMSSHNMFGIKSGADWQGAQASVPTVEYENGVMVRRQAAFRAYASPADSFADYARLLTHDPRYSAVAGHGNDVAGFAHALVDAGYATDPAYADKLTALADSDTMREALASLKNTAPVPSKDVP